MTNHGTKVWIFILSLCLSILVIGYFFGGRLGLMLAFIVAIVFDLMFFFFAEAQLLKELRVHPIQGQDAWGLNQQIQKIATELKMSVPNLYWVDDPSCNMFCLGGQIKNKSLGLTQGLLERLNSEELYLLLTHQMTHLKKMDSFSTTLLHSLGNTFIGTAAFLDSISPWNWLSVQKKYHFFLNVIYPACWFVLKIIFSEKTFLKTDQTTAQLSGKAYELSKLLWKLQGWSETLPLNIPRGTHHLFLISPNAKVFLQVHPSVKKRIHSLLGYYPV